MKRSRIKIFMFATFVSLFAAHTARATGPTLSTDTFWVNFPIPSERSLDRGYIEKDSRKNEHAVKVRIDGGRLDQHWKLYVRAADKYFSPRIYGKSCKTLLWKFDQDTPHGYRKLSTGNQLVASGSGGKNTVKNLDLRMLLDWSSPPALYGLELIFTLVVD